MNASTIVLIMILPIAEIVVGIMFYKNPIPQNGILGYRTPSSQMSQETWDFAQKYCGKVCMIGGILLVAIDAVLAFVVLPMLALNTKEISNLVNISVTVEAIFMFLLPLSMVEHSLKKNFDDNGHPVSNK